MPATRARQALTRPTAAKATHSVKGIKNIMSRDNTKIDARTELVAVEESAIANRQPNGALGACRVRNPRLSDATRLGNRGSRRHRLCPSRALEPCTLARLRREREESGSEQTTKGPPNRRPIPTRARPALEPRMMMDCSHVRNRLRSTSVRRQRRLHKHKLFSVCAAVAVWRQRTAVGAAVDRNCAEVQRS